MTKGRDPEQAFLDTYDPSVFPRPSVAVDVVVLSIRDGSLRALVHRRPEYPQAGRWALPGGFVGLEESLDAAAARVLAQKAGLTHVFLEQLYTFGEPARDPRTRVISVAYYALVDEARLLPDCEDRLAARVDVPWTGERGGPVKLFGPKRIALAFDHEEIVGTAVRRIRGKLDYAPIGFQLLPERFTLLELQRVHEVVLGRALNKDSFRRRMLAGGQLKATGELQDGVDHRPAELYRFVNRSAV